ncbi:MAG: Rrf2 family transcriptional regulator [Verrucomicrobia bacterium]|nr:MAG: Rrf2 family transcriptional regulator [Verrucomicrobiota bacterium]
MLGFSKTVGYAIRAMACIGQARCHWHPATHISRCAGVPKPYLSQILFQLAHKGLVQSRRGVGGGFALARPPRQIPLLEIVEAVEGPDWIQPCLLGFEEGALAECPTRALWDRVRADITKELSRLTLADVMPATEQPAPSAGCAPAADASSLSGSGPGGPCSQAEP